MTAMGVFTVMKAVIVKHLLLILLKYAELANVHIEALVEDSLDLASGEFPYKNKCRGDARNK